MKTNTKTVLIIVATLVIGILIGALGSGFMVHRFARRMADMRHREMFVERMMEVIEPAPEQEAEVRDILTRHAEEFTKLADGFHKDTAALFDSLRSELDPVLTDEQKERLEVRHERLGRFMKHGHRPPHHKPGAPPPAPPGDDG
jgi:uncharacterized membrane-anchored protein YhcB (DUF1043 family)